MLGDVNESNDDVSTLLLSYDDDTGNHDNDNDNIIFLSLLFRLTSSIGVVCAVSLAMETYALIRTDQHKTMITYRILFVIACNHMAVFLCGVFGSSAAPVGTTGAWGAIGNEITCTMQGFAQHCFFVCSFFWDATLSLTYVAMVKYNLPTWKLRKLYQCGHIIIWPIGLAIGILPIPFDLYHFTYQTCVLNTPPDCREGENEDCEESMKVVAVVGGMGSVISTLTIGCSIVCMFLLYRHVAHLEHKNRRYYSGMLAKTNKMRHSRKVGVQGMLYASTALITLFALVIASSNDKAAASIFEVLAMMIVDSFPLWNLVLFMRERPEMRTCLGRFLRRILCCTFQSCSYFCCCFASSLSSLKPCGILARQQTTMHNETGEADRNMEEIAAVSYASVVEEVKANAKKKNVPLQLDATSEASTSQ